MFERFGKSFSIVDKGLTFDGELNCKGKLIVNGTIKGKLIGETVVIGEGGSVYADVEAVHISIGGTFQGNLIASALLVIMSTGNCSGNFRCKKLVLEPGGILNGDVNCPEPDIKASGEK
jgi:cytoskeletal protein CcmA (bactofilin family)